MDDDTALKAAVEIAKAGLMGEITSLQTGQKITAYIDPWHPVWEALNGSFGPLVEFYAARDAAARLQAPADPRTKALELKVAEVQLGQRVRHACEALIEYAEGEH